MCSTVSAVYMGTWDLVPDSQAWTADTVLSEPSLQAHNPLLLKMDRPWPNLEEYGNKQINKPKIIHNKHLPPKIYKSMSDKSRNKNAQRTEWAKETLTPYQSGHIFFLLWTDWSRVLGFQSTLRYPKMLSLWDVPYCCLLPCHYKMQNRQSQCVWGSFTHVE